MGPMRPLTDGSRLARLEATGDVVALCGFLVVGLDRHGEDAGARFAALAVIFVGAWLVTAWLVGTYRPPTDAKLALTLAIAVPVAVLVRALLVREWTAVQVITFVGVGLVFCALFVGVMRLAVLLAFRRGST